MAFIIKPLGKQNITTSGTATLYTVPASKSALVNNVRIVNKDTNPSPSMTLNVVPSGGSAKKISQIDFTANGKQLLTFEDVVTLSEGDAINLYVGGNSPSGITCVVSGVEQE